MLPYRRTRVTVNVERKSSVTMSSSRNTGIEAENSGSADSQVIRYRSDIDGLRAIAVLSVVFFHLLRRSLPGGYLGVDLFFVLSGYLITAIIWREMQEGRFSIVRFYDRRIRRIMPALLLLLFVTTVVSVAVLLPTDLIGYGKSLFATLVFAANIYFWRDTDYFSPAAEQKPLLHIWSLGVEEQFYILFPLILVLVARWWPRRALHAIAVLTLGSLATNVLALFVGGGLPAFFLLPTRAWELGAGAMLALLPTQAAPRAATAGLAALVGAVLVAMGIFHPVDSYWFIPVAAPAVIGTALLILSGQHDRSPINWMLGWRPLVFVGLISYSLYLWHWPVIVLSQYYLVREFTLAEMAAALALMTACAIGSWWFVERPFRSRAIPIRTVRFAAGAGVAMLAAAAAGILWAKGLPGRLSADASVINQAVDTNYRCPISDFMAFGRSRACTMNLPSRKPADADVVLLGNSHAQMYAPVWMSILAARGETGLLVPVNGCLPTVQANISRECSEIAKANLSEISRLGRARIVIIGLTWAHEDGALVDPSGRALDNGDDRALIDALIDLFDRLHGAGKQVVLIGPLAEPGWNIASMLSRDLAFGHRLDRPTSVPTSEFMRRYGTAIRYFEARSDIFFARPDKVQCSADRCDYVIDGRSLFSDSNHIASAELPRYRKVFEAALPLKAVPE
jgi:peptidoglycan/LPS O-acetylase OafA/YrhL